MPHLRVNDVNLHYQQAGDGPGEVVLVHAVTGNLTLWMFCGLTDALVRDGYRVTAYDLRGHGLSELAPTGYTSADMAADFAALHAALGLRPAYLVGHSFGGAIAMHAALLSPALVRGIVLSDTYFPGLSAIEPNLPHADVWVDLRRSFGNVGLELGERVNFDVLFRVVAGLTQEQKKAIRGEMGDASSRWLAGLPRLAETTCGRDLFDPAGLTAERLKEVRQPVAALYDEHSPFTATYDYLREHLADCVGAIVPGAKHLAPVQNPTGFVALVRQHLAGLRNRAEG